MPTSEVLPGIDLSDCPLMAFANIALLLEEEGRREILEAATIKQKLNQTVMTDTAPLQVWEAQVRPEPGAKTRPQKRARESLGSIDNDVEEIKPPKRKSKANLKKDSTQEVRSNLHHELFREFVASFPKFPKNVTVEERRQALLADPSIGEIVNERQVRCAGCHQVRNLDGVYFVNNWTKHHQKCRKLFENWLKARAAS